MGAIRRQWMPIRPPFLPVDERFDKNMSSYRIKVITHLIYRFI